MIGFNIDGMCPSYISNNLIDEIRGNIDGAWCMDRLDFRAILKCSSITDMKTVFCHVHVLDKKSQRLSNPQSRFIQEPDQQPITLIGASIEEGLHLVLGDGLRALPLLCRLFQDMFLNRGTLGDMMEERFVPPETCWQVRG